MAALAERILAGMRSAQQRYRFAQARALAAPLITSGEAPELFGLQRDGLRLAQQMALVEANFQEAKRWVEAQGSCPAAGPTGQASPDAMLANLESEPRLDGVCKYSYGVAAMHRQVGFPYCLKCKYRGVLACLALGTVDKSSRPSAQDYPSGNQPSFFR